MTSLRENAANLQAFFNSVQGFFFVIGRDNRILAGGEQGAHRLGRTSAELVGTDINDLHPPEERGLSRIILSDMFNGTRTSSTETLEAADGTRIPVSTLVTRGSWNGALALFTTSQDITGSRKAAEALAADRRRADALYSIIAAAGKAHSLEEFLPEALRITLESTPFEGGGIYLVDGDQAVLACTTGLGKELVERVHAVPVSDEPFRTVFQEGKLSVFTEQHPLPTDISQHYGLASMMAIPLVAGTTVVGALNIASAHSWSADMRTELLMSIGRTIGAAVARLRAYESLKASRQDFETLFEAMPGLVFILQEDGTIAKVNTAAARRLGWKVDELRGMSVLNLCSPDRRQETICLVADMIAGRNSPWVLSLMNRDGEPVRIETRVVRATWDGGPAVFMVSRELISTGPDDKYPDQALLNDELTGLYSASGFSAIAGQQLKMTHRGHTSAALVVAEIISGTEAEPPGPQVLADFASVLRQIFRDADTIGHIGTARFGVLTIQTDSTCFDPLVRRLEDSIASFNAQRPTGKPELAARVVVIPVDAMRPVLLDDLLLQADAQLGGSG